MAASTFSKTSFPQGIPPNKDWSQLGVLNEVRDQEGCNCCWCITACTCCEAKEKITHMDRPLIQLAPQDIINCYAAHYSSRGEFDAVGCYTGSIVGAFRYIKERGVMYERDCPFRKKKEDCMVRTENTPIYRIQGHEGIKNGDEQTLLSRVNDHPVGAGIEVTPEFEKLKGGTVYRGSNLARSGMHAVVIVGYGEKDGINYWKIMNSWGTQWGEDGYGLICRDSSLPPNRKSLLTLASYPILNDD